MHLVTFSDIGCHHGHQAGDSVTGTQGMEGRSSLMLEHTTEVFCVHLCTTMVGITLSNALIKLFMMWCDLGHGEVMQGRHQDEITILEPSQRPLSLRS